MIVKRLLIGLLVVGSILALSGCVSAIDITPNVSGIVQEEINQEQPREYHDNDSGKPDSETELAELVKKQLDDLSKKSKSELLDEMNKLITEITNNQNDKNFETEVPDGETSPSKM